MAAQSHWIDPVFMEAAVLCQPSWLNRQMNVCLPLAAPGILAALGLVGAFSMGELPLTLMVVPPGKSTLIIRIYQSLHYGASQESAIYGLFLYSVTLIVCVLALSVAITWNRYLNISEVKE
jgi:iron(III) transport system permease protein